MKPVDFTLYEFKDLPPLTQEQQQSPYARFYRVPVQAPPPEIMAGLGERQMDPALALPADKLRQVFSPGEPPTPCGWCIMPDGTSYSRVLTRMPGVTPEMEAWWHRWSIAPDYDFLHYCIWLPGLHKSHAMPIVEDLGWGFISLGLVQEVRPDMLGLSARPEELDPSFIRFHCIAGVSLPEGEPDAEPYYITLSHCFKRTRDGIQVLTQAYHGLCWQDGGFRKMHDADPDRVRVFLMHNAWEFRREALLLPEIFAFSATL